MSWVSNDLPPQLSFRLGKAGERSHSWLKPHTWVAGGYGSMDGWWPAAGDVACFSRTQEEMCDQAWNSSGLRSRHFAPLLSLLPSARLSAWIVNHAGKGLSLSCGLEDQNE